MSRLWAVAALFLAGCATPPLKQPASTEHGALAIRLSFKGRELPSFLTHQASEVFWAKLNAYGDLDLDHPVLTTLARDGDCYVLDVPPGKYAPFAAAYSFARLRYLVRIDNDLRKQLTVEVRPGAFTFGGEVLLRTEFEFGWGTVYDLGLHVLGALPPFHRPTIDVVAANPKVDLDVKPEAALLKRALLALAGTLWTDRVEERLTELGRPADPIMTGFIRRKALPTTQTERFRYVDTFEWGKPKPLAGGLEWREPKGRARVVVGWVDDPSGEKRSRALEKLKLSGESGDEHVLFDVWVDSHPGRSARYTTFVYPEGKLVGADAAQVYTTQTMVVDGKGGYFLLMYRAQKEEFGRFLPAFTAFVEHILFRGPEKAKGYGFEGPA